jgi:hypothetical protein
MLEHRACNVSDHDVGAWLCRRLDGVLVLAFVICEPTKVRRYLVVWRAVIECVGGRHGPMAVAVGPAARTSRVRLGGYRRSREPRMARPSAPRVATPALPSVSPAIFTVVSFYPRALRAPPRGVQLKVGWGAGGGEGRRAGRRVAARVSSRPCTPMEQW